MFTSMLVFADNHGRLCYTTDGAYPLQQGNWRAIHCQDVSGGSCRLCNQLPDGLPEQQLQLYLSNLRCHLGATDRRWLWIEVDCLRERLGQAAPDDQFDLCGQIESRLDELTTPGLQDALELNLAVSAYFQVAMSYMGRGDTALANKNGRSAENLFTFACHRLTLAARLFEGDNPEDGRCSGVNPELAQAVLAQLDIGRTKENTPAIWILLTSIEKNLIGGSPDDEHAVECAELAEEQIDAMLEVAEVFYGRCHFLVGILLCQKAECRRIRSDNYGAMRILEDARIRSMEWDSPDGELRSRIEVDMAFLTQGWDGEEVS